jgi:hypothetical protein
MHAVPIFVQSVHAAPLAPQAFGFDPTKHCEPEQQPVQLAWSHCDPTLSAQACSAFSQRL